MLVTNRPARLEAAVAAFAVLLTIAVPTLCAKSPAPTKTGNQAKQYVVVTLRDGSRLVGRLRTMADNCVTMDTSDLGRIQVPLAKIQSIRPVDNRTSDRKQQEAPSQQVQSSDSTADILNHLLQTIGKNPEIMSQIQRLSEDPEIREVIQDPEVQRAVRNGDLLQLLQNSKILRMMDNARIRKISKQVLDVSESGVGTQTEGTPLQKKGGPER